MTVKVYGYFTVNLRQFFTVNVQLRTFGFSAIAATHPIAGLNFFSSL